MRFSASPIGRIFTALTPKLLTGLLLLHPLRKRTKNNLRGPDRVEIYREIVPGMELATRNQRTPVRADSYPNPNQRPIVSNLSLFNLVNRLAAVADRYIGH